MLKKLIEQKKLLKRKKPSFLRQDGHKKKKLEKNWRRPRGIDNKIRLSMRGYRRKVKVGYGTPDILRHKDAEGRTICLINNLQDLEKSGENDALVMASGVGIRKRILIIEKAIKMKKTFTNLDINVYVEKIRKDMEKRKEIHLKLKEEKKKKTHEEKKPKSIEEKVEVSDEDKKKLEKEEKDKILRQDI